METNQQSESSLHFIITGGTIDSHYDPDKCTVIPGRDSVIPEYLKNVVGLSSSKITFTEICMKDSRDLTQKDIGKIKTIIETSSSNRFLITHGTYTLSSTAKFLEMNLDRKDVTVVLTGAMIPLTGFCPSDAGFNLGFALANVFGLPPGVFVCIFGEKWLPDQVPGLHV